MIMVLASIRRRRDPGLPRLLPVRLLSHGSTARNRAAAPVRHRGRAAGST
jgi:hypothetical protein